MDFLVQFRLVGPPKLTKPIKLIGAEAGWRQDIYTWFVLLSNKAPWTFLQYWGILSRFLITTYICSFNPDIEFGVLDILNYGLDALYFVDVLSTILLW